MLGQGLGWNAVRHPGVTAGFHEDQVVVGRPGRDGFGGDQGGCRVVDLAGLFTAAALDVVGHGEPGLVDGSVVGGGQAGDQGFGEVEGVQGFAFVITDMRTKPPRGRLWFGRA